MEYLYLDSGMNMQYAVQFRVFLCFLVFCAGDDGDGYSVCALSSVLSVLKPLCGELILPGVSLFPRHYGSAGCHFLEQNYHSKAGRICLNC